MTPIGARARWGIAAWCLYDWANSSFSAVIATFVFAAYFARSVAPDVTLGTAQWSWAVTGSGLLVAALSPVLGAVADAAGRRKPWLFAFTLVSATACGLLWFVRPEPGYVMLALVLFGLANASFELAGVFYNAMLPDIAPRAHVGRISGWAWGLGYLGGLACLVLVLLAFVRADPPPFGLDRAAAEHVRASGPVVAAWFALFALPLFLLTPDQPSRRLGPVAAVRHGLASLAASLRRVRSYGNTVRYLVAHMLYTDGLNTVFVFGGIYAAGTFDMDIAEVLAFGIALNVSAGIGAAAFAWVDDWIGPRRTILVALAALIAIGTVLLLIRDKDWFWIFALALGVFVGPVQAASRSLMARLAPRELRVEMFGLYALSGKATAFAGPLLLGWITLIFDSQRIGMATVLVLFAAGLAVLVPVREPPRAP